MVKDGGKVWDGTSPWVSDVVGIRVRSDEVTSLVSGVASYFEMAGGVWSSKYTAIDRQIGSRG